ncbi:MAG: HDIG domain-containing protein [Limnochordia bacterium]|jgi:putative nucleotidyltransferase with HDIG domain|nr:HDIG domain-containing protein [Limnochordia bacterium]
MFTKMKAEDYAFVHRFLNEKEQALFRKMTEADQRHCVAVAEDAAEQVLLPDQQWLLTKAALLHDIGKGDCSLLLLDRILYTIMVRVAPDYLASLRLSLGKKSFFTCRRQALYIQHNHAKRGAHLARSIGCPEDVVRLIGAHHGDREDHVNMRLLKCLQDADRRN